MTVSKDATGPQKASTTGTSITVSYAPTGTLRGLVALIVQNLNEDNPITEVRADGEAMTEMTGSPQSKAAVEDGAVFAYFLGSGINAGTIDIVATGGASGRLRSMTVWGLNATGDVEEVDTYTVNTGSTSDSTGTLSLGGRDCFCAQGIFSGLLDVTDPTNGVLLPSNWTADQEIDHGSDGSVNASYDIIGSTDVTAGYTATGADDCVLIAVAVAEVAAGGGVLGGIAGPGGIAGEGGIAGKHGGIAG